MDTYVDGTGLSAPSGGFEAFSRRAPLAVGEYPNALDAKDILTINPARGEPYTKSLYQTPYDEFSNLVSTGTLINGYTGEAIETFENQLPPPNTDRSLNLAQLKQSNPKLTYAQGGYDPNCPPPRRQEHGAFFNAVDAVSGASPFAEAIYTGEIRKQLQERVQRDIFNVRDGIEACEPSYGEPPIPQIRAPPYMPPTQVLNTDGRVMGHRSLGDSQDNTKREQYSGQNFARKAPAISTRRAGASQLPGGTQGVPQIPITYRPTQHGNKVQYYIQPVTKPPQQPVQSTDLRPTLKGVTAAATPRLQGIQPGGGTQGIGHGVQALMASVRPTLKGVLAEATLPVVAIQPSVTANGLLVTDTEVRATLKGVIAEATLPLASLQPQVGGAMGPVTAGNTDLRPTLKGTNGTMRLVGIQPAAQGDLVTLSTTTLRPTQKTEFTTQIAPAYNPVGNVVPGQYVSLEDRGVADQQYVTNSGPRPTAVATAALVGEARVPVNLPVSFGWVPNAGVVSSACDRWAPSVQADTIRDTGTSCYGDADGRMDM